MSGKRASLGQAIDGLSPAEFAMVMATGIVSSALNSLGMRSLALVLFTLDLTAFIILIILSAARLVRCPDRVVSDLLDHNRGPGYFTIVAATCVLGSLFVQLHGNHQVAVTLWLVGLVLWVGFTYTVFTGFTIKEEKPTLADGISGAWLLAVVATQSVALLSAQLSDSFEPFRLIMNFFALSMWLWGGMMYIWMISLIFYRYTFFRFSPSDLSPPYWINMGAMAISTLVGTVLIENTPHAPFLLSTLPFLKGFTIFYWATGSWWLPMLIILAVWRHVYKRFPLRYDPLYWGAVFPLGMYTACTLEISRSMSLHFLEPIPRYFIWFALAAWVTTFVGLVLRVIGKREEGSGKRVG